MENINTWHFDLNEKDCNYLLGLVLQGKKRATTSSLYYFELSGEPLPKAGDLNRVTYWDGTPGCIIRTTNVRIMPYKDITFDIAKLEGEDDDLDSWRRHHRNFFSDEAKQMGYAFSEDVTVVFEEFELVEIL